MMNPIEQVNYIMLSTGKKVIVWCTATGIIEVMADPPSAVLHHIGTKMNPQSLL
jgi:hypothetical protein